MEGRSNKSQKQVAGVPATALTVIHVSSRMSIAGNHTITVEAELMIVIAADETIKIVQGKQEVPRHQTCPAWCTWAPKLTECTG